METLLRVLPVIFPKRIHSEKYSILIQHVIRRAKMHLISDPDKDHRSHKPSAGSYEWWYFDAVDPVQDLSVVIIFYEGNPFSPNYIQTVEDAERFSGRQPVQGMAQTQAQRGVIPPADRRSDATAEDQVKAWTPKDERLLASSYPAVSISVYSKGRTIYYSFQEASSQDVLWGTDPLEMNLCGCEFQRVQNQGELVYELRIDQHLPSGLSLQASLRFQGSHSSGLRRLVAESGATGPLEDGGSSNQQAEVEGHYWNLVQGKARVRGSLTVDGGNQARYAFNGFGYHDHNLGTEPMKESFRDWYWGRFHSDEYLFIYYIMFHQDGTLQARGWIEKEGSPPVRVESARLQRYRISRFGLKSARLLSFSDGVGVRATVHLDRLSDDGPFYQRFHSIATLFAHPVDDPSTPAGKRILGISEYISPRRIHARRFWPLVRMRMQFLAQKPHWVQKSRTLYRWTW